jgi:hypothetical protein
MPTVCRHFYKMLTHFFHCRSFEKARACLVMIMLRVERFRFVDAMLGNARRTPRNETCGSLTVGWLELVRVRVLRLDG